MRTFSCSFAAAVLLGLLSLPLYGEACSAHGVLHSKLPDPDGVPVRTAQTLEDFVVPGSEVWEVDRVSMPLVPEPLPESVDVRFYLDEEGSPGPLVCSYSQVVPAAPEPLTLALPHACVLCAGKRYRLVLETAGPLLPVAPFAFTLEGRKRMPRYVKGDFNGDLCADLVFQRHDGELTNPAVVWFLNGSTRVGEADIVPAPPAPGKIVATNDFDGDGDTDLVVQYNDGPAEMWWMAGTVRLGEPEPVRDAYAPEEPMEAYEHPLRGSGLFQGPLPDLLCQGPLGEIVIWNMQQAVRLNRIALSPDGSGSSLVVKAQADFDFDGETDLLMEDPETAALEVWPYRWDPEKGELVGGESYSPNPGRPLDANWRVLALADLGPGPDDPGDVPPPVCGASDILWQNRDTQRSVVWHLDGAEQRTAGLFTVPDGPGPGWVLVGPR